VLVGRAAPAAKTRASPAVGGTSPTQLKRAVPRLGLPPPSQGAGAGAQRSSRASRRREAVTGFRQRCLDMILSSEGTPGQPAIQRTEAARGHAPVAPSPVACNG